MNQPPKKYKDMKNKKIDEDDVDAMLEGVFELTPQGKPVYAPHNYISARDIIKRRLGIVTVDQLMNAAKAKQRFETTRTREIDRINAAFRTSVLTNTPFNEKEGPILEDELPDLSAGDNQQMLRHVATIVLNSSQVGDTIQTMADKVVVFCAYISNNFYDIYLSDDLIMSIINGVFQTHNTLIDAWDIVFTRLRSLNLQMLSRRGSTIQRRGTQPMELVDGGFYKKNYRKSIKTNKSRKLRSRR